MVLYHGPGATDYDIGAPVWAPEQWARVKGNTCRFLRVSGVDQAKRMVLQKIGRGDRTTNGFGDEFTMLALDKDLEGLSTQSQFLECALVVDLGKKRNADIRSPRAWNKTKSCDFMARVKGRDEYFEVKVKDFTADLLAGKRTTITNPFYTPAWDAEKRAWLETKVRNALEKWKKARPISLLA